MCLIIDKMQTKKALKALKGDAEFWKVFAVVDGALVPLFQGHFSYSGECDGTGRLTAAETPERYADDVVAGGAYHAYVTQSRADAMMRFMGSVRKCVMRKVSVRREDILAYGREGDVAFRSMVVQTEKGDRL